MADRFVEKTHQGYFSRLASSFVGVLIGFLLIPGSVALISYNEYRTIHRTRGLLEAENVVEEVADSMEVLPAHDDKLVHLTGRAETEERLTDSEFGLERVALRLARSVEMYQWVERKETKTRDKLGGGKETITTYEYDKRWESDRVDSQQFRQAGDHANPPLRYASKSVAAQKANVGGYRLTSDQVTKIENWQEIPAQLDSLLAKIPEADRGHFSLDGSRLYWSSGQSKPDAPQLGDLRITFRSVEPTELSILAKQKGDSLMAYSTSNGESIESFEVGTHSAEEMFQTLRLQNSVLAWMLRGVGWFMACLGFGLIIGPLSALSSIVPLLGRLVGMATFAVALVLGSAVSIVAIGVAWLAVRPLMAIGLFAAVGLMLAYFIRSRKPKATLPPRAVLVE